MSKKAELLMMTREEEAAMPYQDLLALRRAAYDEHLQAMEIAPEFVEWQAQMVTKYGPLVQVWQNIYDSYLIALLVVRYGEALQYWPLRFSDGDYKRAQQWYRGTIPTAVVHFHTRVS
ncbi:MAG: hypothetical protein Q9M19_04945 [Mariprofundaceae bacterium]|nr:hypothetical protein [Mariprofundaceae bacterium]